MYNKVQVMEYELINHWNYELSEPPCTPGSGRYGVRITLQDDISAVFPYLNSILEETVYDHANKVLIGRDGQRLYAFRPQEIQVSGIDETTQVSMVAKAAIELVNRIWRIHPTIKPRFTERKLPAAFDIYRYLPKTNCRKCGYATCLVFAEELRQRKCSINKCPLLSQPEYATQNDTINKLFAEE